MAVLRESPLFKEICEESERKGLQEGLRSAIALGLELKFGADGLTLMPEIDRIADVGQLQTIRDSLRTTNSLDEIRQIYRQFQ